MILELAGKTLYNSLYCVINTSLCRVLICLMPSCTVYIGEVINLLWSFSHDNRSSGNAGYSYFMLGVVKFLGNPLGPLTDLLCFFGRVSMDFLWFLCLRSNPQFLIKLMY